MKRTFIFAYVALFLFFALPRTPDQPSEDTPPEESPAVSALPPAETPAVKPKTECAPVTVLIDGTPTVTDMTDYLTGVVAAEMPALFETEALKAQAVAARTYALYCAGKHADADVCTDPGCCQAWISPEKMRENWGENYGSNYEKIRSAVESTAGEYLIYEGEPIFAAFHSSSCALTEDSGAIWNALPYLVSVTSPESSDTVPNYVTAVQCSPLDFRDTVLSACPEADFSGEESGWIGQTARDGSGRVESVTLGGVNVRGTELRRLFSLRSTAFTLEYTEGVFIFSVTGFGHGVGMSQYGANTMAARGEVYTAILAHYYPQTEVFS